MATTRTTRSKRAAPDDAPASLTSPSTAAPKRPTKAPARKRARLDVEDHELKPATGIEEHRLPFADADVYYVPDLVDEAQAQLWHDELAQLSTWYQPTLKVYGRCAALGAAAASLGTAWCRYLLHSPRKLTTLQRGHAAAYATDPELTVNYSGTAVRMEHEWPPVLLKIKDLVEARLGTTFNHCMLNRYEDGKIYIGKHRDNRENRVIASVSLGAERTFIMSHDKPPATPPRDADGNELLLTKRWTLANGSLVVMQGDTQKHWKHEIPRETKVKTSRISITLRQLLF